MQEMLGTDPVDPHRPRLYTVEEFRRRVLTYYGSAWKWVAALLVALAAFYTVFFAIAVIVVPEPQPVPQPLALLALVLFFLGQFLVIGIFGLMLDRAMRASAVTCESCRKDLDIRYDLNFAIALHSCPYCQKPLFQEWTDPSAIRVLPDAVHAANGEFTFAEIREAEKRRTGAMKIWFVITILAAAIAFGITRVALWVGYDLLTAAFADLAREVANLLGFIPALVVLAIGIFWSLCRTPGTYPKCAHCGTRMEDGRLLRATGNCRTCGRRVIRDAPLFQHEEFPPEIQRMDVSEFNRRVHRYAILAVFSGIGLLGVAFVWIRLVSWWFGSQNHASGKTMETVTLVCGVGVLLIVFLWMIARGLPRPRCPHCRRPLEECRSLVRVTGNCCHCGGRVLESGVSTGRHAKI